jgi:predicted lipoprotein with Yx(FWY)xxD motif
MLRLRTLAALAALSSVLSLAAACGGDDGYGNNATSTPAGQQPAGVATPGQPTAGSSASASEVGVKIGNNVKFGSILTTSDGFTLYTFIQDAPGKSNCNGSCAATWPPVTTTAASAPAVPGAPGKFTLVTRDDGSKQVAYDGKPLYRYTPDKAPGDTNGQGVGNVWFVATAAAATTPAATSSTPASGSADNYGY